MEFSIGKSALYEALSAISAVAARRTTMPILGNVMVRCDGGSKLQLAATDLNSTLVLDLACEGKREGGVTLPAQRFAEIVGALKAETVQIKIGEQCLAEIKAGRSRFELSGLSWRDFPELPKVAGLTFAEVDRGAFIDAIDRCEAVISPDDTRYNLCGLYVDADDKRIVAGASDGLRIHVAERAVNGGPRITDALIPRNSVKKLRRVLDQHDKVELAATAENLIARASGSLLSVKLLSPNWPKAGLGFRRQEHERSAIAPRLALIEALERAAIVAGAKEHQKPAVKLTFEEKSLHISGEQSGVGASEDFVDVVFTGKSFSCLYVPSQLVEALSACPGDEARIGFMDDLNQPVQIEPVNGGGFWALCQRIEG